MPISLRPPRALAAVASAAALLAPPACAWGFHGHQTVGGIADQLIAGTPTAKKVRAILGGNLQMASVWADCARSVERKAGKWIYANSGKFKACAVYENAASQTALIAFVQRNASFCAKNASHSQCRHKAWHFTNIPIQLADYTSDAPGAAPNDLVQAMAAAITVLQGGKPAPAFNIASRREALRLLAHFVGDLHQPLHVGALYLDSQGRRLQPKNDQEADAHGNAGGNAITLKKTNLHGVWDDVPGGLATKLLAGTGATEARQVQADDGAVTGWPVAWASDTLRAAPPAFQALDIQPKVDGVWPASAEEPAYSQARENLQRSQLVKAGARLAQLLTTLLP